MEENKQYGSELVHGIVASNKLLGKETDWTKVGNWLLAFEFVRDYKELFWMVGLGAGIMGFGFGIVIMIILRLIGLF